MSAPNSPPLPAHPSTIAALEQLRRRSDTSYEGRPACDNCRRRKTKCDRQQPVCGRCARLNRPCTSTDILMRRGPPSNKERAAYEAAGLPIPSLKHRQRTRRAQGSAIPSARSVPDSATLATTPPNPSASTKLLSLALPDQPCALATKLAPPSDLMQQGDPMALPPWPMRPRGETLPPGLTTSMPPPPNPAQASSPALPMRTEQPYAHPAPAAAPPPPRIPLPYMFGPSERTGGSPTDPWLRDWSDPRRLYADDRTGTTTSCQPQQTSDWSALPLPSPLSLSFHEPRPPTLGPRPAGASDDLQSTAYGAASGSSNASTSSTSTSSSASIDTATNLPSVANGLVVSEPRGQGTCYGPEGTAAYASLYPSLHPAFPSPPGGKAPRLEPFGQYRLDGPTDALGDSPYYGPRAGAAPSGP